MPAIHLLNNTSHVRRLQQVPMALKSREKGVHAGALSGSSSLLYLSQRLFAYTATTARRRTRTCCTTKNGRDRPHPFLRILQTRLEAGRVEKDA